MRALFVTNRYPPHLMGGYEVSCKLVADGLRARGHDIHVLTSTFAVRRPVTEGYVYRWLHLTWESTDVTRLAGYEVADHGRLQKLLARLRPDVIFNWCLLGLFPSLLVALARSRLPLVYQIQDLWLPVSLEFSGRWSSFWDQPASDWLGRWTKPALRTVARALRPPFAQRVRPEEIPIRNAVFCSQFQKDLHLKAGIRVEDSVVVYNGVDSRRFSPGPARHCGDRVWLLFVGRLCHDKGAHVALEALTKLVRRGVEAQLTVVGVPQPPFEYGEALQRFVAEQKLLGRVRFVSPIDNDAMPEVYRQHDVLILPSFHQEGFSIVLLEAMACGLAVVATPTGGSPEILRHQENSLVFEPGDAVTLAEHLELLIRNPGRRASLAESARTHVASQFSQERMVEETERYLLRVVNAATTPMSSSSLIR